MISVDPLVGPRELPLRIRGLFSKAVEILRTLQVVTEPDD